MVFVPRMGGYRPALFSWKKWWSPGWCPVRRRVASRTLGERRKARPPHHQRPVLHPFCAAADRHDAGARHLDKAERQHELDELVDLLAPPGDLEDEALDRGIDHARPERVGEP